MSLILKGIDIPTDGQIEIIIRPHGKVFSKTRGISAEAIQIPKGHGRLVDADELLSHLKKDPLFSLVERYGISGVIESRPTILDKEKE